MGVICIEIRGNFKNRSIRFPVGAQKHALAVASAIEWLARQVLPEAIAQDLEDAHSGR